MSHDSELSKNSNSGDGSPVIEVEYFCKTCNVPFVVYHTTDDRNTHCWFCQQEVTLTGLVNKIEGTEVVTYKNGIEIARRPDCGTVNPHRP